MVKLVKAFAALVALLPGHFAAGAGLRKKPFPNAEGFPSSLEAGGANPPLPEGQRRLSLENAGKGCWGHCGETAGDCGYCGSGQCCRAVDYRNQVVGCELAENAVGARCGAYKGSGFPALLNVGLPCIGACGKQPGDCDYCGTGGQCCRPFDGERCVPGCELASSDSWMMPGSQCGQFKDPSATPAHCPAPPTTPPTNPPTTPPTNPPTTPPTNPPTTPPTTTTSPINLPMTPPTTPPTNPPTTPPTNPPTTPPTNPPTTPPTNPPTTPPTTTTSPINPPTTPSPTITTSPINPPTTPSPTITTSPINLP